MREFCEYARKVPEDYLKGDIFKPFHRFNRRARNLLAGMDFILW